MNIQTMKRNGFSENEIADILKSRSEGGRKGGLKGGLKKGHKGLRAMSEEKRRSIQDLGREAFKKTLEACDV